MNRNEREPALPVRWSTGSSKSARAGSASPVRSSRALRDRDESDPQRQAIELVQRGRMILEVSEADLEASEAALGPFHPTTWHFRNALSEVRRSWERLRAELGTKTLEAALDQPPLTVLTLGRPMAGSPGVELVLIGGQTYRTQRVAGTELAPIQWRLTRLHAATDDGPYYVCRLADGSTQCDCAQWIYRIAETGNAHKIHCKHLAALSALAWI